MSPGCREFLVQPRRVTAGGLPISFDPRILNFRVMRCCWADAPAAPTLEETGSEVLHFRTEDAYVLAKEDIATPELGLRFGRGWHGFERWDGEPFRWVGNDAGLAITGKYRGASRRRGSGRDLD